MEAHEQIKNGNALKFLRDYWFIIVFLASALFGWSEMRAQIQASTIIDTKQQMQIDDLNKDLNVLDKKYIEDISIIKTKLDKLNK